MIPSSHSFTSPLRYPGGKGALANFMKLVVLKNKLCNGHYIEVYAGGAGIAWPLLFEEYIQRVHINDLSRSIYAFWKAVLFTPEELCKLICDIPVTIEEWYRQREKQGNPEKHSALELAFSTFFLNRTNRSGIITGGVIGGKKQDGRWRLDTRFNKRDLIARIERIARYSKQISLYNLDAVEFITKVLPSLPKRALVYLDPPYYSKGDDLYENRYRHQDHMKVAKLLIRWTRHPWIVSYDTVPEIISLYQEYRSLRYKISYSAQTRYAGSEIMFFHPSLVIPRASDPIHVKSTFDGHTHNRKFLSKPPVRDKQAEPHQVRGTQNL